jgi:hypothetical protein
MAREMQTSNNGGSAMSSAVIRGFFLCSLCGLLFNFQAFRCSSACVRPCAATFLVILKPISGSKG